MELARQRRPGAELPSGSAYIRPDASWSRRARGAFGNELATAAPADAWGHVDMAPASAGNVFIVYKEAC